MPSDRLAELGPFFVVDRHPAAAEPLLPWRRLSELVDDPERLTGRITAVRAALARAGQREPERIEWRVAASTAQLGIVARLIAVGLGTAVQQAGPSSAPDDYWWQDLLGGPLPLSLAAGTATPHGWPVAFLDRVIAPIGTAVARVSGLSSRVRWGNVASAVNSAHSAIEARWPEQAGSSRNWAVALLRDPRLAAEPDAPSSGFQRRSCCLIYRLAPGREGICGDCVLG